MPESFENRDIQRINNEEFFNALDNSNTYGSGYYYNYYQYYYGNDSKG